MWALGRLKTWYDLSFQQARQTEHRRKDQSMGGRHELLAKMGIKDNTSNPGI